MVQREFRVLYNPLLMATETGGSSFVRIGKSAILVTCTVRTDFDIEASSTITPTCTVTAV
jgi:hypothetical protein